MSRTSGDLGGTILHLKSKVKQCYMLGVKNLSDAKKAKCMSRSNSLKISSKRFFFFFKSYCTESLLPSISSQEPAAEMIFNLFVEIFVKSGA